MHIPIACSLLSHSLLCFVCVERRRKEEEKTEKREKKEGCRERNLGRAKKRERERERERESW